MSQHGPDIETGSPAAEAADWLVRVQSDAATGEDWLALEAWLAASEENRAAFEQVELLWASLDDDRAAIAAGLASDAPSPEVVDLTARRRPAISRRAWLAGFGAAAAAIAVGVVGVTMLRQPAFQVYETSRGQTRSIQLADGSTVSLNGASRISVRLERGVRRVIMDDAEAAFDVAKDPQRPFVIEAGDRRITVVGTEFNVHNGPDAVTVTVRRGVVAVGDRQGEGAVRVTPGRQLVHPVGSGRSVLRDVEAADAFAWRQGRIIARDRRLEDVVADLNRQLPTPLTVEGSARDLRFTGVLVVEDEASVVATLEDLLPVRASRAEGQIRLVSRR